VPVDGTGAVSPVTVPLGGGPVGVTGVPSVPFDVVGTVVPGSGPVLGRGVVGSLPAVGGLVWSPVPSVGLTGVVGLVGTAPLAVPVLSGRV
jgi:hypothetical protein